MMPCMHVVTVALSLSLVLGQVYADSYDLAFMGTYGNCEDIL